jgi:pyruvate formate lyase activating enzyme
MKVGLQKTSLVDYPGKVASVFFFPMCNIRCPWCQNGSLITGGEADSLCGLEDALAHIRKRRKVLGGVVLSGGEPLLWDGLAALLAEIKALGLSVKLDTNGLSPDALVGILASEATRPDYVAMDLKLSPERYQELGAPTEAPALLARSAGLLRGSGVAHEFRTLALPAPCFTQADAEALKPLAGNSLWKVRAFAAGTCLVPEWNEMTGQSVSDVEKWIER